MITRVLVPTDFSPPSDAALDYARVMARHFGASLRVLHVVDERNLEEAFVSDAVIPISPAMRSERLQQAHERLSHRVKAADGLALPAKAEVVFGKPSQVIVDYANDHGFDLIVMGTHGREGLAHLLMGSVAELVVRTARCPVMTLHERQEHAACRVPLAVAPFSATA